MKGIVRIGTSILLATMMVSPAMSMINPNRTSSNSSNSKEVIKTRAANCAPATALTRLAFNNVNAILETGGNMWQDRAQGFSAYEVPKGSGLRVMFAGALWLGGKDFNDQLKVAAITFRQNNDFWPGPLTTDGLADVSPASCLKYDKFFPTLRQDIITFNAWWECVNNIGGPCDPNSKFPGYTGPPSSITDWPGNNFDPGYDLQLAPYKDIDGDGLYNPGDGDYPWYDIKKELACGNDRTVTLYGDQNYWWVFNDKGNIHTETGADPIGMEIRAQAFAFSTNDEVNDMTFYNYEVINQGTQTLYNTYFGQWCDPDVGFSEDDFVGCDVQRGLGYAYNGDAFDDAGQGQAGYGANPPAVGIDFFQGPFQDNDNLDNPLTTNITDAIDSLGIPYEGIGIGYGDTVIDNERFGMRKFLYYFRDDQTPLPAQGEPNNGTDYYRYLQGIWLDGTPFYFGGTAHQSSAGAIANGLIQCDYMFPGNSDPVLWGTHGTAVANATTWTESNEGNTPADRRFMQSAGPFTLTPGQKNNITVGVVYARSTTGNSFQSVEKLRLADDKAQALFDNCFKILDAPDAPDLTIQELDKKLVIYITNPSNSNNNIEQNEDYFEKDPFIVLPYVLDNGDSTDIYSQGYQDTLASYEFQGYKLFQLKDATVSSSDLTDPDKARLVAQCDIKDGVGRLINFIKDEDLGYDVPTLMVDGEDAGVRHSFLVETDAFTQATLVNHKTYYYMCVAYAYNNFKIFDPTDGSKLDGQKKPYIESRKSPGGAIVAYSGIPHIPVPETAGTVQNSDYGDGPQITRIEGSGNGTIFLDLTSASEDFIVTNYKMPNPTYLGGAGPINVKVVDPLNVKPGLFELRFLYDQKGDTLPDSYWELLAGENMTLGDSSVLAGEVILRSDRAISAGDEQIIPEFGISIQIQQITYQKNSAFTLPIDAKLVFADSSKRWLTGISDAEGNTSLNWIRCGTQQQDENTALFPDPCTDPNIYNDYIGQDDGELYEGLLEGTWAPYRYCAEPKTSANCPAGTPISFSLKNTRGMASITELPNVDIVFTADKSKWTRCPVVEMQEDPNLAEGGAGKQKMRAAPSRDKNGKKAGDAGYNSAEGDFSGAQPTGMSWFPGYAIDIETGERLNMAFGEDSWLAVDNGRDMIWNPTNENNIFSQLGAANFCGKHYVYIFTNQDRNIPSANRMIAYDGGNYIYNQLILNSASADTRVWRSCVWVGMPILADGYEFDNPTQIPTTAKIKLRVEKKYNYYTTDYSIYLATNAQFSDTSTAVNAWRPKYRFSLDELAVENYQTESSADSILNLINVVPNPYYAYSTYESNRLDTRVKITNLPEIATIKIFNVSGQLVRTYTKDSPITSLDWDLKNNAGIPISSGVYIIHIEIPEVGEKILKWFGGMRPPDLQSF